MAHQTDHGGKTFECPTCDNMFSKAGHTQLFQMWNHYSEFNDKDKEWKCFMKFYICSFWTLIIALTKINSDLLRSYFSYTFNMYEVKNFLSLTKLIEENWYYY